MKVRRTEALCVLLLLLPLLISSITVVSNTYDGSNTIVLNARYNISRISHGHISIYGDIQFNQTATSEGWAGNGSEVAPFIIEGYIISNDGSCISIMETNYYYIIQDCEFTTGGGSDNQYALNFRNAPHGILNYSDTHDKIGGMTLDHCSGFVVLNSIFSNTQLSGLEIYQSSNCIFENNTFVNTGIGITGYIAAGWDHTFSNNIVNGKPLYYVHGQSNLLIDGSLYGQIILAECTNCTVTGAVISNTPAAIALGHCIECYVYSNEVSQNRFGILLSECQDVYAIDNIVGPSNEYGIHLNDSQYCVIQGNNVFDSLAAGIDCIKGLGNMIILNSVSGSGYYGIVVWESMVFIVYNNTVFDNNEGISIMMAPSSQVFFNIVENNTGTGITFGWGSDLCYAYCNRIGWNTAGNALDDGSTNFWDNGVNMGNFWSDYSGTGTYSISGNAGSVDNYPLSINDEFPTTTTTTSTTTSTTTTTTTTTTVTSTTESTNTTTTNSGSFDLTIPIVVGSIGTVFIIIIIVFIARKR